MSNGRGFETFGDLDEQGLSFIEWDRTFRDALQESFSYDQLHDQELLAAGFFQPVERRNVLVVQGGKKLRFSLEAV